MSERNLGGVTNELPEVLELRNDLASEKDDIAAVSDRGYKIIEEEIKLLNELGRDYNDIYAEISNRLIKSEFLMSDGSGERVKETTEESTL